MQAKAKLSYLKMSPKKVRLVADMIRGMKAQEALTQLNFLDKAAKRPISKLLNSAIANAENNLELKKDNLYIKEIRVDQAGMLKRWKPRAHGRATPIRKKMSHIMVVLAELKPTTPKKKKKTKKTETKPVKVSSLDQVKELPEAKKLSEKSQAKKDVQKHEKEADKEIQDVRMEGKHRHQQHQDKRSMKGDKGFINKIFNRKSG